MHFRLLTLSIATVLAFGCGDSDDDGSAGTSATGESGHTGGGHGGSGEAGHGEAGHGGMSGHDVDGGHTSCGLQENCGRAEEVTLAEGLTVEGKDGNFDLHVHMHNHLSAEDNEWMVMIMDDNGDAVAGADLTVSTWSDDCGHPGPTDPQEVTTNDSGMATINPVAAHGGPWDVIVEVDADGTTDIITIPLCIPGASHGDHMADDAGTHDAGDHSGHSN